MFFVDPVDSCSSSNSYLHIVLLEVQNFYEILIFAVSSLKRAKLCVAIKTVKQCDLQKSFPHAFFEDASTLIQEVH